jgi:hypothetical protein
MDAIIAATSTFESAAMHKKATDQGAAMGMCPTNRTLKIQTKHARRGRFDLICVYWFSYRNRYKPVWVYISGVAP